MEIISTKETRESDLITRACAVLEAGGLVLFPTETTYGAGVDATNPAAVEKLLSYKSRREGKPLSIAVPDKDAAAEFVEITEQAESLYSQFLPGPVTVVSRAKGGLAPGVASEFGTVGVRIPDYDLMLKLLKQFGKPVTATSANGSGKRRPYAVSHIMDELSEKQKSLIDLVLDAGELPHNPPSTVIDTTLSAPVTLRSGDVQLSTEPVLEIESTSEAETKELAARLLLSGWDGIKESGLILGVNGPLGAGKTVFAKGAAEFLKISDTLKSPTYSYIEEYQYQRHGVTGMLYHLDMWKVESAEQFAALEIAELARPGNVLVIEWWSQVGEWLRSELAGTEVLLQELEITDLGEGKRACRVGERGTICN